MYEGWYSSPAFVLQKNLRLWFKERLFFLPWTISLVDVIVFFFEISSFWALYLSYFHNQYFIVVIMCSDSGKRTLLYSVGWWAWYQISRSLVEVTATAWKSRSRLKFCERCESCAHLRSFLEYQVSGQIFVLSFFLYAQDWDECWLWPIRAKIRLGDSVPSPKSKFIVPQCAI